MPHNIGIGSEDEDEIDRIQNRTLIKHYSIIKEDHRKIKRYSPDYEKTLWHGTNADSVVEINYSGFNRGYAGKTAAIYGRGVYLAVKFSLSALNSYAMPDNNGLKRVYQCKAFVGEYTKGGPDLREAPRKPPPSAERYDSVVDNPETPTMFVVFKDGQVYPEYLIHFH